MYSMQEMYVAIHVCGSSIKSIGLLYLVGLEYALWFTWASATLFCPIYQPRKQLLVLHGSVMATGKNTVLLCAQLQMSIVRFRYNIVT